MTFQYLHGPVTCVVCRQVVEAETELPMPFMHPDLPSSLTVGDSLLPAHPSNYDHCLLQLRARRDSGSGVVFVTWGLCPVCRVDHWATVGLGMKGGVPIITSLVARPLSAATLDECDWMHPGVVNMLVHGTQFTDAIPRTGPLTPMQRDLLRKVADTARR